MNYLLDTRVISEFTRRKPEEKVIRWLEGIDEDDLYLSAITIGEIQHGIERLAESHRKTELQTWLGDRLIDRFGERILAIDTQTMLVWGSLVAQAEKNGHPLALMDSLIAACALQNNLALVTRNVEEYRFCGVQVINPWD